MHAISFITFMLWNPDTVAFMHKMSKRHWCRQVRPWQQCSNLVWIQDRCSRNLCNLQMVILSRHLPLVWIFPKADLKMRQSALQYGTVSGLTFHTGLHEVDALCSDPLCSERRCTCYPQLAHAISRGQFPQKGPLVPRLLDVENLQRILSDYIHTYVRTYVHRYVWSQTAGSFESCSFEYVISLWTVFGWKTESWQLLSYQLSITVKCGHCT